jgi:sulfite reductase (NADPH) flavoprotein alpha-component
MSARPLKGEKEEVSLTPGVVHILYATHTGTSRDLAAQAALDLEEAGVETAVSDTQSFPFDRLREIPTLLAIISTDGDGEPPLMAEDLFDFLGSQPALRLDQLDYSVLALGDSCYYRFCEAGKQLDGLLQGLGAHRFTGRVDCDLDYEESYADWIEAVKGHLCQKIQRCQ